MKIYLGADHAGFELKEKIKKFLTAKEFEVEDMGPYKYNSKDDYPDYAIKVCEKILRDRKGMKGILFCGSGHGMCIAANKFPSIRATICWSIESVKYAKTHTNVNVLCIPARLINLRKTKKIVLEWLELPFRHEKRHIRRINKIKKIEKKYIR